MAWTPTTDDLLNLTGVGQRIDGWRFELLDQENTLIGQVHPSRASDPSISNDGTRSVRRQLTNMLLMPDEATAIDPLSNRIRPVAELQNGDEFSMGVFLLGDRNSPVHSWGSDRAVTWSDKSLILDQAVTRSIGWGKGADIAIAIVGLVLDAGLTTADLGQAPASTSVFGAPVAYPPGTNRLTIIEDFALLLGWYPPFFDRDGLLRFVDVPDLAVVDGDVPGYGPGTRVHAESVVESDSLLQAPNQFVVVEASGRSSIRGVYNVSAAAPHSEANTNRVIPLVKQVQGLTSTSQANRAARALATTSRKGIFRFVAFDGTFDPRHETWTVVPWRTTTSAAYENWVELDWGCACRAGSPMVHHLRKVF